jgi:hypothetical protein
LAFGNGRRVRLSRSIAAVFRFTAPEPLILDPPAGEFAAPKGRGFLSGHNSAKIIANGHCYGLDTGQNPVLF